LLYNCDVARRAFENTQITQATKSLRSPDQCHALSAISALPLDWRGITGAHRDLLSVIKQAAVEEKKLFDESRFRSSAEHLSTGWPID
jgi:hypothetical protein